MNSELEQIIEEANQHLNFKKQTLEYTILEKLALASKKLGVEEAGRIMREIFATNNKSAS